jgi:hypothetical protein
VAKESLDFEKFFTFFIISAIAQIFNLKFLISNSNKTYSILSKNTKYPRSRVEKLKIILENDYIFFPQPNLGYFPLNQFLAVKFFRALKNTW